MHVNCLFWLHVITSFSRLDLVTLNVCLRLSWVGWNGQRSFPTEITRLCIVLHGMSAFRLWMRNDGRSMPRDISHMFNDVDQRKWVNLRPVVIYLTLTLSTNFTKRLRSPACIHMPVSPPLTLQAFLVDHCLCPLCSRSMAASTPGPSLGSSLIASDINGRWMLANYSS